MTSVPTTGRPNPLVGSTLVSFWCGWGIDPCPVTLYNSLSSHPEPNALLPRHPPCRPPDGLGWLPQRRQQVQSDHRPRGSHCYPARRSVGRDLCRRRAAGTVGVTPPSALCVRAWGSSAPLCGARPLRGVTVIRRPPF